MALHASLSQQRSLLNSRAQCSRFVPFSTHAPRVARTSNNVPSICCSLVQARQIGAAVGPSGFRVTQVAAAASSSNNSTETLSLSDGSVSVVLLAGGVGKRMGAAIPKQYLELKGQPIATYSLVMFGNMPQVGEIVIVCDPSWRFIFEEHFAKLPPAVAIKWALPGAERQDSVFNGLQQASSDALIVAVHDSARPLVTAADALRCMLDGYTVGAAVLGVAVKPTIKEVDADMSVVKTLNRSKLWEVQTPQCIRPDLLKEGFRLVKERGLEVTDDVSIIEAMGLPVRITPGAYTNIKVTTPDDMSVAEKFLDEAPASSSGSSSGSNNKAAAAVPEVQQTW